MLLHVFSVGLVQEMTSLNMGIQLSASFITCADKKLSQDFTSRTGISVNKDICLKFEPMPSNFFFEEPTTSIIYSCIVINSFGNMTPVFWKSKSGKMYSPSDEFDCEDVDFWFGELDTAEFFKQLAPTHQKALKIKDLNYQLDVRELRFHMTASLILKESFIEKTSDIRNAIYEMVDEYNNASMKKDRIDGVVHNIRIDIQENTLVAHIDIGSAGMKFLKKLLRFMSSLDAFEKVILD